MTAEQKRRGLEFQQNVAKFRIGVLVVHVPKNQIADYETVKKELLLAVEHVCSEPGN